MFPIDLDFGPPVVCQPSAQLANPDDNRQLVCSLADPLTEAESIALVRLAVGCSIGVAAEVYQTLVGALARPEVIAVLETTDAAATVAEAATARSRFEQVVAVIGFVLPATCITSLADILSGGQYQALEDCLANDACYSALMRSLGLCGEIVCPVS